MTCQGCEYSVHGHIGRLCPLFGKVSPAFSTGCSQFRRECPTEPSKSSPSSVVVKTAIPPKNGKGSGKVAKIKGGPNATEAEYRDLFLAGKDARFEGCSLKMANGHTYTGDWAVYDGSEVKEIHECKGAYAFFSQARARLAFDQCRIEFPHIKFFWGRKGKKGKGWKHK